MTVPLLPDNVAAALPGGPAAVTRAVAAAGGTPFHDDGQVTLMYVGVADGVALRHWLDVYDPIPPFVQVAPEVWATTFPFPSEARVEYKIDVLRHGRHRLRLDGLNPQRASNPWGDNSELRGVEYQPPKWATLDPTVSQGQVRRLEIKSQAFGDERALHVYLPAVGRPGRLLIVHDGDDYLQFARLGLVLDNLIAGGELPPVAAVMVEPGDRMAEYRADPTHAEYLVREVVSLGRRETGADEVVVMGASLGGVASLHAATTHPGEFAGLILQAGSFVTAQGPHGRGPVFAPVIRFMKRFLEGSAPVPPRIHVSCGRYDGLIAEAEMMRDVLARRGAEVGYADVLAGHDWHAWRDLLRPALNYVVGEPGAQG